LKSKFKFFFIEVLQFVIEGAWSNLDVGFLARFVF
jgi:hypothetical protein